LVSERNLIHLGAGFGWQIGLPSLSCTQNNNNCTSPFSMVARGELAQTEFPIERVTLTIFDVCSFFSADDPRQNTSGRTLPDTIFFSPINENTSHNGRCRRGEITFNLGFDPFSLFLPVDGDRQEELNNAINQNPIGNDLQFDPIFTQTPHNETLSFHYALAFYRQRLFAPGWLY
ncbi:MAG: hypothetical protein N2654_02090, partial [Deltaproteobacteria bacterium]|nr:hypothetical protein [Deltaproteobacteria bacterium]